MKRLAHPTLSLSLTPYPMTLHFFTRRATFNLALKNHRGRPPRSEKCEGLCAGFDDHILVGVFNGDLGTLVHELTHAMEHITDFVDLPRGPPNEPAAYLMAHMFRQCAAVMPKADE